MSLYMRAVLADWTDPPFDELVAYVSQNSTFEVRSITIAAGTVSRSSTAARRWSSLFVYDDSVAAANPVIEYFEQQPGVLSQVNTIGWDDGDDLNLEEP